MSSYNKCNNYADAFGHLLLNACGVPTEYSSLLLFAQSLAEYRLISKMADDDVLLVLVDEIGHLESPHDRQTLSALMSAMDTHGGKLIFIFAHIMQEFLNQASTGSGRPVIPLPLPPLEIDIWKKITGLVKASSEFPALHQLFLSCSGHPRSIFEGISLAKSQNPTLLTNPNPIAISNARQSIIYTSKFNDLNDETIHEAISSWFSQTPLKDKELSDWKCNGLLHTMKGSAHDSMVQFLFPLLVQDWARRLSNIYPIAFHLQQLYDADACLDQDSEKNMEAVMYHYEAVLRIAQDGKPFFLVDFFHSEHVDSKFKINVTAPLPSIGFRSCVSFVDNFEGTGTILEHLKSGLVVVSEKHSEIGTEYLVPFHNILHKTLMVAFIQCKFVKTKTNWSDILDKSKKSLQYFEKSKEFENVEMFRVVYTTVDQDTIMDTTFSGGVYFTENDLFNFTNKLGILRLHTQKLGEVLQKQYPMLKRASSDIT
jgi:hypothetical protein